MSSHGIAFHSDDGFSGVAANESVARFFSNVELCLAEHTVKNVVVYDCREVRMIDIGPEHVGYAKIIRALTNAGVHGRDWWSFLKWYFRPSRAIGIWNISNHLMDAGFQCAKPILAARKRNFRGYPTDIIVTDEVRLPDLWQYADSMLPDKVVEVLVNETLRLHKAGFAHGDYILRNVCLDVETQQLVLLDNDRTWHVPAMMRNHYQFRNVAQMCYSLMRKYMNHTYARRFLDQYAEARQGIMSSEKAEAIFDACAKRAEKYLNPRNG